MVGPQRLQVARLTRRVGQLAHHVHAVSALARSGVWANALEAVQQGDTLHTLLLDSTTVRAHPRYTEFYQVANAGVFGVVLSLVGAATIRYVGLSPVGIICPCESVRG